MIHVLYFAWVKEKVGVAVEDIALPETTTAASLIALLRLKSPGHAEAFADPSHIRVAVNQEHVRLDALIRDGDEVAFFPPVTGG